MSISIYTDGSAIANKNHLKNGQGGFGVAFYVNKKLKKTISKGVYPAKIGMVELLGILTALKVLAKDQRATIYSDSKYALNCFNKNWLRKWEREGWPVRVKNVEIMKFLLNEHRKFYNGNLEFKHVRGHTGVEGNEVADSLANYKVHKVFEEYTYYLK